MLSRKFSASKHKKTDLLQQNTKKTTYYPFHAWCSLKSHTYSEAATGGVLQEKVSLEISQNSQENEISKNTFFTEHPWATASGIK